MKIEIKNGKFRYGIRRPVFTGLNFSVGDGEILSILGPNGTGKTTLLKCLLGIHEISEGALLFNGKEPKPGKCAHYLGYVPQSHQSVFQYTVIEMVLMGRTRYIGRFSSPTREDREISKKALDTVGMADFADRIFTELSGGERQMVLIARALASEPDGIIFDEPTSALDYRNQYRVLDLMISLKREQKISIIMTTHQPEHALYVSDKVLLMNSDGNSCFGETDQVLSEENLNRTYGMEIGIFTVPHHNTRIKTIVPLVSGTMHQHSCGLSAGSMV